MKFISLKNQMIFAVVVPFMIALLLISTIVFSGSQRSVTEVMQELGVTMQDMVQEKLEDKLSEALRLNMMHKDSYYSGRLDLEDEIEREKYFSTALRALPTAAMTFVATPDGQFYGARRLQDGAIQVVRNNQSTAGASMYYNVDGFGVAQDFAVKFDNYDARTRPWYQIAVSEKNAVFSDVYKHFVFEVPTVTASKPVYVDGQLVGVFGVDLLLTWLSDTLEIIPVGENGRIFIVDQEGLLVACCADDFLEIGNQSEQFIYNYDSEEFLTSTRNFQLHGVDWDVYIVLAKKDFLAGTRAVIQEVTIALIILALSFLGFAFWFADRSTRRLVQLNQAAQELANGNYRIVKISPPKDEITELTQSFNMMGMQISGLVQHLEGEVRERTKELEQALAAKDVFLANFSHEVRSPLNVIIGMSDIVLEMDLDDTQREYIDMVNESAKMLLRIINQILDYSKLKSGKLVLHDEQFDLRKALKTIENIYVFNARDKNIDLHFVVDQAIPDKLSGDVVRLQQVLINLIGNGIKFTESGYVKLTLDLVEETEQAVKLRFAVTDTGMGIPTDKQALLFNSFSQVDSSFSRVHEGTGLGLAISQEIIGLMGSEIILKSKAGEGSEFSFVISFAKYNLG